MKEMTDIEKRTVTINRTFDAPIKTVWEAWTQPDHIVRWWGPAGMNTRIIKHDFSEGGEWEFAMSMPDGNDFVTNGIYKRIVTESLIETTADFKPMTEGVTLLIEFIEKGKERILSSRSFILQSLIEKSRKKWASTMVGAQRLTDLTTIFQ